MSGRAMGRVGRGAGDRSPAGGTSQTRDDGTAGAGRTDAATAPRAAIGAAAVGPVRERAGRERESGGQGRDAVGETGVPRPVVPRWLQVAGGWSWRLLFIGVAAYLVYRVVSTLAIVVVPCLGALLLTALLQPLTGRLQRTGMPKLAATWCTLLVAVVVIAAAVTLVTVRVQAEYPSLVVQLKHTSGQVQGWLAHTPFHLRSGGLQKLATSALHYLEQHKSVVAGKVVSGGVVFFELLGGAILLLFVTFFLLKDGERIWTWFVRVFGSEGARRADRAGRAAWHSVVYYVRGTVLVATIHAVVIGSALTIMGVPLVAAMVVLVFVGAFIPLVGLLFAGAVVALLTVATKGLIAAVVLVGIFVAEDQLESHLLQPLVVGRIVRLHPLAIILVLAAGAVVAGIVGALIAVPVTAAITRAVPELRRRDAVEPRAGPSPGDEH